MKTNHRVTRNKNRIVSFLLLKRSQEETYLDYLRYLFDYYIVSYLNEYGLEYNYKMFFSEFVSWVYNNTDMEEVIKYKNNQCVY